MQARTQHYGSTQRRAAGFEYSLYFALVFAISLVPAAVHMVLPKAGQPRKFFVTDAWHMAQDVTPVIFSAL